MPEQDLPSFRSPPVVETVLGVQFDPLRGFTNAHLGAFWKFLSTNETTRPDCWNHVNDAPPIEPAYERFDEEQAWAPELAVRFAPTVPSRLQIRDAAGDAMVQVQNGRLHYNWIGSGSQYRRYNTVRPAFDRLYAALEQFVQQEKLGDVGPNQWEVTYVNHLPRGTVWDDPSDWPKVFTGLPGVWASPSVVRLEGLVASWHFEIPERKGRLHIDLKRARRREEPPEELLRLTLTARGPVAGPGTEGLSLANGLDLGHRVIVLTFRDVTSTEAHRIWEIEE